MKNVLFIMSDALRPDFLGCYNSEMKTSPNIDKLAERGILFQNAIAPSCGTSPSVPAVLTSTYSSIHGRYFLNSPTNIISGFLQKKGMKTGAIVTNPYLSEEYGFERGFDYFRYLAGRKKRWRTRMYMRLLQRKDSSHNPLTRKFFDLLTTFLPLPNFFYTPYGRATEVTEEAIPWIYRESRAFFFGSIIWIHIFPFFLLLLLLSHIKEGRISKQDILEVNLGRGNYLNLNSSEISLLKKLYEAEISFLDSTLGKLFDYLQKWGLFEKTVIVLTADHREAFGEHGFFKHPHELYDILLHVPLIIYAPSLGHKVIDQPVSLLNIPPTICELLGIEKPPHFQGDSLIPLIRKGKGKEGVISEAFKKKYEGTTKVGNHQCTLPDVGKLSYRTKKWKYLYNLVGKDELYNLREDPREQRNLIEMEKEIGKDFRKKLKRHISNQAKRIKTSGSEVKKRISKIREKIKDK